MKTRPIRMKPVGILGGGQLARMMALKAHDMGVPVAVYSSSRQDPAAQVVSNWTQGELSDQKRLLHFLRQSSVATFESEFMDAPLLSRLNKMKGSAKIFPLPSSMGKLQDRLTQKRLIQNARLPTAPFVEIKTENDALAAHVFFGGKLVFKKRRFGYDGYGTWIVRNIKDLEKFLPHLASDFESKEPVGFIAEALIPFRRELAVVLARSRSRDVVRLPFVETHQENARCLWVKGPLPETKRRASFVGGAEEFLKSMDYIGLMAFELFEAQSGELVVNEIAPRVHNSAHYSLEAVSVDQFTLHLQCVLGHQLNQPKLLSPAFAMMNLIGSSSSEPSWAENDHVKLHWYGKSQNRSGRKMGHITALGSTPEKALKLVLDQRGKFSV